MKKATIGITNAKNPPVIAKAVMSLSTFLVYVISLSFIVNVTIAIGLAVILVTSTGKAIEFILSITASLYS